MKIEHLAIWVEDLERARDFYVQYFDMQCSGKYINEQKQFASYFLSFAGKGARIELMHRPGILKHNGDRGIVTGFTHIAISVGSKENVNALTERMRADGITIQSEPRTTGDGYYESVVLDPEKNYIEITE
ncbi:VOC family protein [Ferruginibacter profundus]